MWYGDDSPHLSWKCALEPGKAGENGKIRVRWAEAGPLRRGSKGVETKGVWFKLPFKPPFETPLKKPPLNPPFKPPYPSPLNPPLNQTLREHRGGGENKVNPNKFGFHFPLPFKPKGVALHHPLNQRGWFEAPFKRKGFGLNPSQFEPKGAGLNLPLNQRGGGGGWFKPPHP